MQQQKYNINKQFFYSDLFTCTLQKQSSTMIHLSKLARYICSIVDMDPLDQINNQDQSEFWLHLSKVSIENLKRKKMLNKNNNFITFYSEEKF